MRYLMALFVALITALAAAQATPQAEPPAVPQIEPKSVAEIREVLLAKCMAIAACAERLRCNVDHAAGIARSPPNDPPRPLADIKAKGWTGRP